MYFCFCDTNRDDDDDDDDDDDNGDIHILVTYKIKKKICANVHSFMTIKRV